jgi:hypothetical protein
MRSPNALHSADVDVQRWPAGLWRPKGSAVAGSSDLGLAAVGERQWSWPEPGTASGALRTHLARSDAGLLGGHSGRVLGGSGWSGAHWEPDRAGWPVQQESTATGADLTGRARTSWDGDLRRRTAVDVLPADGMQEVRGSNPRSSTPGQIDKLEILSPPFTSLVQQRSGTMCLSVGCDLVPAQGGIAGMTC